MNQPATPPLPADLRDALARGVRQVNTVVLGKPHEVRLAFVCLLAGGHLLIDARVAHLPVMVNTHRADNAKHGGQHQRTVHRGKESRS